MIRSVVTCDRTGCLAVLVAPAGHGEYECLGYMEHRGWKLGDTCPACAAGRGPVLERGECTRCMGRTVDREDGAHCQYCRAVTRHPADDWT